MEHEKTKLWTGQYVMIITITFLFFLSLQSLLGGFPVFVGDLSNNATTGGLMTTVFMVAAILSRPFIGMFLERLNMKKTMLITLVFLIAAIALSFNNESVPFLIALRIIQGVGFGIITTLLATFATNLIPPNRIGEGIGYFGLSTSIGTSVGPMIALSLIHAYGFNVLLIFSISLTVLTFVGGIALRYKYTPPKASHTKSLLDHAFAREALLPCFLVMIFYITFSGIVNYLDGLGADTGLGGKTSFFFLIVGAMLVLTRPFSGKIYDQFGHKFLIYPACITGIIGLLFLSHTSHFSMLVASGIFYGIAYGIMQPTFQAWAVSRVTPDKKGTANAMVLSFMDLGVAIGAVILGQAVGALGYSAMYAWSSILVVAMVLIYFALTTFKKSNKNTFHTEAS
ncbi:MFS transporter [Priestia filamentosa]|uniref:Uncharacterized protein n=1 Tax=Priestia filamentosa TaxID=1402861 RepID=A0A1X7E3D4_9BACI|nr:MFS transporter [Priestia filamentosa]AKO92335.1 hypothetical protein BEH_09650 [Priestia filamentosa]MDT3762374.1 MFS transporter [Priestia filamentosa]OXS68938.1 MFS transporter [Priestia filamentosa]RJS64358.1 MFS transporter [Priestia filamentosa]WCM17448.1 MFS transporter [Priestia filamentosa]